MYMYVSMFMQSILAFSSLRANIRISSFSACFHGKLNYFHYSLNILGISGCATSHAVIVHILSVLKII